MKVQHTKQTEQAWQQFLDAAEVELAEVQEAIDRLDGERSQLTARRDELNRLLGNEVAVQVSDVGEVPRARLVEDMFATAGGPLTIDDVVDRLGRMGRDDARNLVNSTISGLVRKGVLERVAEATYEYVERT